MFTWTDHYTHSLVDSDYETSQDIWSECHFTIQIDGHAHKVKVRVYEGTANQWYMCITCGNKITIYHEHLHRVNSLTYAKISAISRIKAIYFMPDLV